MTISNGDDDVKFIKKKTPLHPRERLKRLSKNNLKHPRDPLSRRLKNKPAHIICE